MRLMVVFLAGAGLALGACTASPQTPSSSPTVPSPSPSLVSPSASLSPSPTPSLATAKLAVYYSFENDSISVYSFATNTERVIARGQRISHAQFETAALVTYVESTGDGDAVRYHLREISVNGGRARTLFTTAVNISAYAWSPRRTAVGFVGYDDRGYGFYVWNRGGTVAERRRFASALGRDGVAIDDQRVEWSSDGTKALVVVTGAGSPGDSTYPTMFVISGGRDLIPPKVATQAHWLPGDREIVYEDFVAPYAWHVLDVGSGRVRPIGAVRNSSGAVLSRDGSKLVYERTEDELSIHVYDMAAGTDRTVSRSGVQPAWIGPNTIVYTNAARCRPSDDCGPITWRLTGGVTKLGLGTRPVAIALGTTFDLSLLFQ